MAKQFKYTRPENPFTSKVLVNLEAKAFKLVGTFKDFFNEEKRQSRYNDIIGRFHEEVMKAHRKFQANDRCSYESFVDMFLESARKHYIREQVDVIKKEAKTTSGDKRLHPEDGDQDKKTLFMVLVENRDSIGEAIANYDFREIIARIRPKYPVCARILELRREGYDLTAIAAKLGMDYRRLYDVMWPKAKRIYVYVEKFSKDF